MVNRKNVKEEELIKILKKTNTITEEELKRALEYKKEFNEPLNQVLIDFNFVSEVVLDELTEDNNFKNKNKLENNELEFELLDMEIKSSVLDKISYEIANKYRLIPYDEDQDNIYIAISEPGNLLAIDDIKFITGKEVKTIKVDEKLIDKAIEKYYSKATKETDRALEDLQEEYDIDFIDQNKEEENTDEQIENAPAVRLANSILLDAIKMKASDIHIEPFETEVVVRYRIDGALKENMKFPKNIYSSVSTRIKIISSMDIAEKRIPQDGRIEMKIDDSKYDFRVSSLPTVFGEKIVIRILDRNAVLIEREKLGFTKHENKIIDEILERPNGILLVTGPTGSGKTTTLYTFLTEMNTPDKNITTVEDPVEYMLDRINQVNVNSKAGMTFASALRSLLRQDPDVIMLGEIRDEETAQIAVRASITGHFVLSTLHTNDAPSTITRLLDMGLESYLVADAVVGVIAQRLIRRLCPNCKEKYNPSQWEKDLLQEENLQYLYKANGCSKCNNTGYKGRVAIHEIMLLNEEIKTTIEKGTTMEELRKTSIENGMITLFENCKQLVVEGVTTINEMGKTVYERK